jgi:hypothetical protein
MPIRFFCLLTILSFLFYPAKSAWAAESFWHALFGGLFSGSAGEPKPEETLQAPFSYGRAMDTSEKTDLSSDPLLAHPHHGEKEISKILVTYVSEVLSYNAVPNGSKELIDSKRIYFSENGYSQYMNFMQSNNITKVIEAGRFNIKSFVESTPLLLNATALDGRYRWVYEIPIMISYMDARNFNYKDNEPINQKIILTVQIGRVDEAKNKSGILIETWSGKAQKIEKKQNLNK